MDLETYMEFLKLSICRNRKIQVRKCINQNDIFQLKIVYRKQKCDLFNQFETVSYSFFSIIKLTTRNCANITIFFLYIHIRPKLLLFSISN